MVFSGRSTSTLRSFAKLVLPLAITACSGGSGGGGQAPDPVVVDIPIAFVERPLPVPEGNNLLRDDVLDPAAFNPGARLLLKDRASPGADARDITSSNFEAAALYDVKDVEVSYDGSKLLFAMRAPELENVDDDEQPTWNIWEYDIPSAGLRRIISSPTTAEAGQDVAPYYLADGRIVFASTRQRQGKAILLDEGKTQYAALDEDRDTPAFVLHVMDENGGDIRQISFNQSHDLDPVLMDNGRVLFSRWDNAGGNNAVSLYSMLPDGRDLQLEYGYHSQATGSDSSPAIFTRARPLPDGEPLVLLRDTETAHMGGDIVRIAVSDYIDQFQAIASNPNLPGPAQRSLAFQTVATDDSPSPHGHFNGAYPLLDGTDRLLVSWSQCRLVDPLSTQLLPCTPDNLAIANVTNADPIYGIWIYNLGDGTQRPVVTGQEGVMYTDVVAAEPRPIPILVRDANVAELDSDLLAEGLGVIHIRSVYDIDGVDTSPSSIAALADPLQTSADERPARFVRIVKPVPMPDDDLVDIPGTAFGRSSQQLMREIIGYGMVEPDGSIKIKVPANIPFAISILDAEGKRIGDRHNNWLQVMPGEVRECNGCHTTDSELPHGRRNAEAASINGGAVNTGEAFPHTEPALFADAGETMAETLSRINGVTELSVNLSFQDLWTDPMRRPKDVAFEWLYRDLATPAPASAPCETSWQGLCRIVINYEEHIQPLWDRDRSVLDVDGITVLADNSCNTCHGPVDAADEVQVPAAQLEFTNAASPDQGDHLVSYRELFFTDAEQEIVDGALVDRLEQATDGAGNPLFEVDEDGNLILDDMNNPIPVMVTLPVGPVMRVAGARASTAFFVPFAPGGSHDGFLEPAELRLISEWLDIGGQYYNNPFDVPQN